MDSVAIKEAFLLLQDQVKKLQEVLHFQKSLFEQNATQLLTHTHIELECSKR